MKEYPNLGKVAQLENGAAFTQDKDGYVCLNEEQADVIEAAILSATQANEESDKALGEKVAEIEAMQKEMDELKSVNAKLEEQVSAALAKVTELEAKAEQMQNDAELNAKSATEENEKTLADMKAEHETQISDINAKLADAEKALAEKDQTIADLQQKLTEVDNQPKAQEQSAPKNNGEQAPAMQMKKGYTYNPNLSPMENKKLRDEANAKLMQMAQEHVENYD